MAQLWSRRSASTKPGDRSPTEPRPSASIILLSPTNQVLLLHRVQTSSAFPSAHVFPGGNLSAFHDGAVPEPGSPDRHQDGPAYRLGAVRETFEESGILLARSKDDAAAGESPGLLDVPDDVREEGRKEVHANRVPFAEWLSGVGGVPDVARTENLIPFTRWITPANTAKRFTTQMYLYMLPLPPSSSSSPSPAAAGGAPGAPQQEAVIPVPTHDGGLEHTAATFDDASTWLAKQRSGEIVLFPPQLFLLTLVSRFLTGPPGPNSAAPDREHYAAQRAALLRFVSGAAEAPAPSSAGAHRTAAIPWADKVMSPHVLFLRAGDGRVVLGLDRPGPELQGSGRGGDWERVVLVRFEKGGPREVEVRGRAEVLAEERREKEKEEKEAKRGEENGAKL
ncbi:NUDIX domain-containing protein [Pleurostoma richardsiae]|uniref:NUDIX domain-containing protein n=1 Tax=Pleurostoma richardsiae TaxID=41990 RepID=A0AA38R6F5_9PEZI|nr:NUDIX domain-containing protein [Pleurostoma richardsiae]